MQNIKKNPLRRYPGKKCITEGRTQTEGQTSASQTNGLTKRTDFIEPFPQIWRCYQEKNYS